MSESFVTVKVLHGSIRQAVYSNNLAAAEGEKRLACQLNSPGLQEILGDFAVLLQNAYNLVAAQHPIENCLVLFARTTDLALTYLAACEPCALFNSQHTQLQEESKETNSGTANKCNLIFYVNVNEAPFLADQLCGEPYAQHGIQVTPYRTLLERMQQLH